MEVVSPNEMKEIGRKHPPIFRQRNVTTPRLSFSLPYAQKTKGRFWRARQCTTFCWRHGRYDLLGSLGDMSSCLIIFIFFAHLRRFPQPLWRNGSAFGNHTQPATGRVPGTRRFGSATFGTRNYARVKTTMKSGNTFWKIQYAQHWSPVQRIGHFRAN